MSTRVNSFATVSEAPVFTTKPKPDKPAQTEAMERIATENNFPSRQAPKTQAPPRRKPRRFKTGRNQQLNIKATGETIDRLYKAADARNVPLGEMLKQALDTLEAGDRAGVAAGRD
jgi:hypothetical protein